MNQELREGLLRFSTAGSVDDGKSTLIGRLLYDANLLTDDQIASLKNSHPNQDDESFQFALLTDGLKAEREQGITIDVAYRYFSTTKRKFIIADTPGHVQYTRNMVTGISTSNLVLLLVDARKGITEQTRRHAIIASLLHIQHIILCVNKMDLVDYSEEVFLKIIEEFKEFASRLEVPDIQFIPISALYGDNLLKRSHCMNWYEGSTLLFTLGNIYVGSDENHIDPRFPVQWVVRPQTKDHHDFRGFAGRVESGVFKPGDEVLLLPSGLTTRIKTIHLFEDEISEAFYPMSIIMTLEDEIDISRGDMIVKPHNQPKIDQNIDVLLCWFSEKKLQPHGKYILRHTTRETRCLIKNIHYKMDVNTLHKNNADLKIGMNDIARVKIQTTQPLFFDPYKRNRRTGNIILIDETTCQTVAGGMIL